MFSVYDKKTGKETKLPYSVDAKDWVSTGNYTDKKPIAKPKQQAPKETNKE